MYWIDIKDHVHFQVEVLSKERRGEVDADWHKRLKENLYVYRINDLDDLYDEMEEFWRAAFLFNAYLRRPDEPGMTAEHDKVRSFNVIRKNLAT